MQQTRRRTVGAMMLGGVTALAMTLTSVVPALAGTGRWHIDGPDQRQRGGRHVRPGVHAGLRGRHPGRHPVYIYVPEGTPLDGTAPTGVDSLDPAFDPTPGDEFVPCADADVADYTLTQAQIDYMGDKLANQIVAVDEEHFGPMDAADPDRTGERLARHAGLQRAGRELLRLRRDDATRRATSPPTTSTRSA